jgi:undecaprenyl-diphosphatase
MEQPVTAIETVLLGRMRPDHAKVRRASELISLAARGGAAWFALSAIGSVLLPWSRGAAARGLVGWSLGSAAAFGLKPIVDRERPVGIRHRGPSTRSSSMPSAHTAGAVGYAAAAALEAPATAIVVVPLAIAVAWSRVATARHFPTDVAAGAAIGAAAGLTVHLTSRRLSRALVPPSTDRATWTDGEGTS